MDTIAHPALSGSYSPGGYPHKLSRRRRIVNVLWEVGGWVAVALVVILFGVGLIGLFVSGYNVIAHNVLLAPCATEDSDDNCYWDADTMGNGTGRDFVVIDGTVYYSTNN